MKVIRQVPQGDVLEPLIVLIYIKKKMLPEGLGSYINMYLDASKLLKEVRNIQDCYNLTTAASAAAVVKQTAEL